MKRKGGIDYSVSIEDSLNSLEKQIKELMEEIYDKHTKSKRAQIEEYNKLAERFTKIDAQIKQKLQAGDDTRRQLFKRLDGLKEKIEPAEAMLRFGQEIPVSKKSEPTSERIEELKPIREEEAPKIKEANEKLGGRSKKTRKAFKKNKNKTRKA